MTEALLRIQRLRSQFIWMFFLCPLVAFIVVALFDLEASLREGIVLCAFSLPLLQAIRLCTTNCPGCGRNFHIKGLLGNAWAVKCVHCAVGFDGKVRFDEESNRSNNWPDA